MARQIRYQIGFDTDKSGLNELKKALNEISKISYSDFKDMNPGIKEYRKELMDVRQVALQVESALERAYNPKLGTVNITTFNRQLKNSELSVDTIYKKFSEAGAAGQSAFRKVSNSLLSTNQQLKETHSLLDNMAVTLANSLKWNIASSAINTMSGAIDQAYGYVKNLDSSLNDIRIVTNKSAEEMDKFAVSANRAAQGLGKATTDYTNASLLYYQQGLSDVDVAARTNVTLKAANVTGQDTEEVSEQLTAIWNGYKVSAEEAEIYVDRVAAVAAATASDLEELATGMSRVASAAATMGVSEEQLASMLSTIISVTRQAPESIGTAVKTILARITDIQAGLDEDGVTLGNYSGKMAELGVNVLDSTGKLRDLGDVIEEIGGKWQDYTREQQVALAQTMGGQRQYSNLVALFDNWDQYIDTLNIARNAEGTLQKQQDIFMESSYAHLERLNAAWENLYDSLLQPEAINTVSDAFTVLLDGAAAFTDSLGGGLNVLNSLGAIGTMVFSKQIGDSLAITLRNFQKNNEQAEILTAQLEYLKQMQDQAAAKGDVTNVAYFQNQQSKLSNLQYMNANDKQQIDELIKENTEARNAQQQYIESTAAAQDFVNALQKAAEAQIPVNQEAEKFAKIFSTIDFKNKVPQEAMNDLEDAIQEVVDKMDALNRSSNTYFDNFQSDIIAARALIASQPGSKGTSNKREQIASNLQGALSDADYLLNSGFLSEKDAKRLTSLRNSFFKKSGIGNIESITDRKNASLIKNVINDDELVQIVNNVIKETSRMSQSIQRQANETRDAALGALDGVASKLNDDVTQSQKKIDDFFSVIKQQATIEAGVKTVGGLLTTVQGFQQAWTGITDTLSNDDLSKFEKFLYINSNLAVSLPMIVTGITSVKSALAILKVELASFAGPIGIAVAGLSAIAAAAYGIYKVINAPKEAAEEAAKAADQLSEHYTNLTNKVKEFNDTQVEYKNAVEGLKDLQEGTDEYSSALEKANGKANELIKANAELAASAYVDNGVIRFRGDALAAAQEQEQRQLNNARINSLSADVDKNNAQIAYNRSRVESFGLPGTYENLLSLYQNSGNSIETAALKIDDEDLKQRLLENSDAIESLLNSNINLDNTNQVLANQIADASHTEEENARLTGGQRNVRNALESAYLNSDEYKKALKEQYAIAYNTQPAVEEDFINYARVQGWSTAIEKSNLGKTEYSFKDASGNLITVTDEDIANWRAEQELIEQKQQEVGNQLSALQTIVSDLVGTDQDIVDNVLNMLSGQDFDMSSMLQDEAAGLLGNLNEEQFKQVFENNPTLQALLQAAGYKNAEEFYNAFIAGLKERANTEDDIAEIIEKEFSDLSDIQEKLGKVGFEGLEGDKESLALLSEYEERYKNLGAYRNKDAKTYLAILEQIQRKENAEKIKMLADEYKDVYDEFNSNPLEVTVEDGEVKSNLDKLLNADYELSIAVTTDLEDNANYIESQMATYQAAFDAIGAGWKVAAEDARAFIDVFPEIAAQAQLLEDGSLQLTQELVANAGTAARGEIDAAFEATDKKLEFQQEELDTKIELLQLALENNQAYEDAIVNGSEDVSEIRGKYEQSVTEYINRCNDAVAQSSDDMSSAIAQNTNAAANSAINSFEAFQQSAINSFQKVGIASKQLENGQNVTGYTGAGKKVAINKYTRFGGGVTVDDSGNVVEEFKSVTSADEIKNQLVAERAALNAQLESLKAQQAVVVRERSELRAARDAWLDSQSNAASGKGNKGSKTSKSKELKDIEDQADIYHDINNEIKDITNQLEILQAEEGTLFGPQLTSNLKKQLDLIEQQVAKEREKLSLMWQQVGVLRGNLDSAAAKAGISLQYDDQGRILNYEEASKSALSQAQAAQAAGDEDAASKYQEFFNALNEYEDLVYQDIADQNIKILELGTSIDEIHQKLRQANTPSLLDTDISKIMEIADSLGIVSTVLAELEEQEDKVLGRELWDNLEAQKRWIDLELLESIGKALGQFAELGQGAFNIKRTLDELNNSDTAYTLRNAQKDNKLGIYSDQLDLEGSKEKGMSGVLDSYMKIIRNYGTLTQIQQDPDFWNQANADSSIGEAVDEYRQQIIDLLNTMSEGSGTIAQFAIDLANAAGATKLFATNAEGIEQSLSFTDLIKETFGDTELETIDLADALDMLKKKSEQLNKEGKITSDDMAKIAKGLEFLANNVSKVTKSSNGAAPKLSDLISLLGGLNTEGANAGGVLQGLANLLGGAGGAKGASVAAAVGEAGVAVGTATEGLAGFAATAGAAVPQIMAVVAVIGVVIKVLKALWDAFKQWRDKKTAANTKEFTLEIEAKLNTYQLEKDWRDFKKKMKSLEDDFVLIGGKKSSDFIKKLQQIYSDYSFIFGGGSGGIAGDLANQLNKTMAQLNKINNMSWWDKLWSTDAYARDPKAAVAALQTYLDQLETQLEEAEQLIEDFQAAWNETWSYIDDELDRALDKFDSFNDTMEHLKNLTSMLYGEDQFADLDKIYEMQNRNNLANLESLKQVEAYWQQTIADMEKAGITSGEAYDTARDALRDVSAELESAIEQTVQTLIDQYSNSVEAIFGGLEKQLTGNLGLETVGKQWDLISQYTDRYLDDINEAYAIQQLQAKYTDAINDNKGNVKAQQPIKNLLDEQLKKLREKDKLTEYDVERAEKLLAIEQARIALQEAQQNKTTMRLRRDANGNYSYQYVADEDAIASADQELQDAYNDLYNFDKDEYKNTLMEMNNLYQDWANQQKAIMLDVTLTEAERTERLQTLNEEYVKLMGNLYTDYEYEKINLMQSAIADHNVLYQEEYMNFAAMTEQEREAFIGQLVPEWNSGIASMAAKMNNFGSITAAALGRADALSIKFGESLKLAMETAAGDDVAGYLQTQLGGIADKILQNHNQLAGPNGLIQDFRNLSNEMINAKGYMEQMVAQTEQMRRNMVATAEAAKNMIIAQNSQSQKKEPNWWKVAGGTVLHAFGPLGWFFGQQLIKEGLEGYDSGGYTGTWSKTDSLDNSKGGKLAVLHQKELVLNAEDTENIMDAVSMVRQIDKELLIDNINNSLASYMAGLINQTSESSRRELDTLGSAQELQQNVHIEATFPNVQSSHEIEDALNNLTNIAAQRILDRRL